jgi:hypothetical protein
MRGARGYVGAKEDDCKKSTGGPLPFIPSTAMTLEKLL